MVACHGDTCSSLFLESFEVELFVFILRLRETLFPFKSRLHDAQAPSQNGLPCRCIGSLLVTPWILLNDSLVCSWGFVLGHFEPKNAPLGVRVIPTDFILQTTH